MFEQDYYGDTTKSFVGVVEEVIDEVFLRVRVFGVHPIDKSKVRTDQLPPAQVIYPVTGGQLGTGSISHNIEVDSWVVGMFLDYPACQNLIVTGVIQGTDYSMSNYETQGGEFVGQGYEDLTTTYVDKDTTMNIPGDSNIQKTYNYVAYKLDSEGSSKDIHLHTSALIGVLLLETSGINPATVGGYKGRAWGICQWLGSRRKQLFRKYGRTKNLGRQLDFMWWELNNTERRAKAQWLRSGNMIDAVAGFAAFERAEEWQGGRINRNHSNFKKRLKFAYQTYNSVRETG